MLVTVSISLFPPAVGHPVNQRISIIVWACNQDPHCDQPGEHGVKHFICLINSYLDSCIHFVLFCSFIYIKRCLRWFKKKTRYVLRLRRTRAYIYTCAYLATAIRLHIKFYVVSWPARLSVYQQCYIYTSVHNTCRNVIVPQACA